MDISKHEQRRIRGYFLLEKEIQEIHRNINTLREDFYNQTLATHTTRTELGIVTIGFSSEKQVPKLVDNILIQERRIENIKKRNRYFKDYLNSLDPADKQSLINRYTKGIPEKIIQLDVQVYEEIAEIEEATNRMNGYPPDVKIDIEINNELLENEFARITELLGV